MKIATVTFSLVVLVAVASADTLHDHIVATAKAVDQALMKKDLATFVTIEKGAVTSDFKHVEMGRTLNFDQMVARMKMGIGMFSKMTSSESSLVNLKINGDHATAEMTREMGGLMSGPDHKPHTMVFSGSTEDVYRKEGGKWKLASMTWKTTKQTIDGKVFDPTKMGSH